MRTRTGLIATLVVAGSATAGAAQETQAVQASPATPDAPASTSDPAASGAPFAPGDGDIVVTARKRLESILKVPVVETALTQVQLERAQITDVSDLAGKVPGLLTGTTVLAIGTQISIRGVGTSALDAGVDQSISLNIDGLQLSQGLAYRAGTFDLAQAEILKGPQALFYGKSSPGGVVSLRSADPGPEGEVVTRVAYEVYANAKRIEQIVSGPINDQFGLRIAATYQQDNGYFRNNAVAAPGLGGRTPSRHFPTENYIVRGTALWKPAADFTARLKANFTRDNVEGSGGDGQYASCPDGVGRNPFGVPFLAGNEDCRLNRTLNVVWMDPAAFPNIRNGGRNFTDIYQKFGTLELNYQPAPALTLTSVTGYYHVIYDGLLNGVETTSAGPTLAADNHFVRRDVTQELRVSSDYSGPLNFTLGGFYQDGRVSNRVAVLGNTALRLPAVLSRGRHELDIESYSGFGQLRWKIVPQLELSGGVRYTDEKRGDTLFVIPASGITSQRPLPTPSIRARNWSPEATVTWFPTDDVTVFGSFKQAYKSGSYSITTIQAPGVDNAFGDEKVQGGEGGIKARLLDRRLTTNLAGYYYKYTGLQVGANEPAQNGLPIIRVLNAGAATIYGIDFDIAYRPPAVDGLNLRAAVNWNHARFDSLVGVPCWGGQLIAEGCNLGVSPAGGLAPVNGTTITTGVAADRSGGRLVRAPTWQINFGLDYDLPVGGGRTLTFSTDNRYSSRYLTNLLGRSDMFQRAYFMTDATLALAGADAAWELAAIGTNLTNRYITGNCTNFNAEAGQILGGQTTGTNGPRGRAGVDELSCQANRGREVWIRLTVRPARLLK